MGAAPVDLPELSSDDLLHYLDQGVLTVGGDDLRYHIVSHGQTIGVIVYMR